MPGALKDIPKVTLKYPSINYRNIPQFLRCLAAGICFLFLAILFKAEMALPTVSF